MDSVMPVYRQRSRRLTAVAASAAVVVLSLPGIATAEISETLTPKYHGALQPQPVSGRIDPETGISRLVVKGWLLRPAVDSNGVFPADEPVLVAIGEESFRIDKGLLRPSRRGRRFFYRSAGSVQRGVRSMRLRLRPNGDYDVRLVLFNLSLGRLLFDYPQCVPMAVIVGDDDGFTGVDLDRKSFTSRRLMVRGGCVPEEDWVWLEQCGPEGC